MKISKLCKRVGMTRQNYYKQRQLREDRAVDNESIIDLVLRERQLQPRLGGRKVLFLIKKELQSKGISIGRDCFFKLLKKKDLLIKKKKSKPKTTNSRHCLPVFHNLIKDLEVTAPNEVWVSDITHITTEEGFMYAPLISDKFSRKIVGANIDDTLESYASALALKKALCELPEGKYPIHHSDRGSQYCCHDYVNNLMKNGLSISMTEENHCYENATAERINGILKQEYELDQMFKTKQQAIKAFYQAVYLYNNRRPHLSLGYKTPAIVHGGVA